MNQTGSQIIGNHFSSEGDSTFRAFAPQQQQWLPQEFREATPGEIDQAVKLAAQAFTVYKKVSAQQRVIFPDREIHLRERKKWEEDRVRCTKMETKVVYYKKRIVNDLKRTTILVVIKQFKY